MSKLRCEGGPHDHPRIRFGTKELALIITLIGLLVGSLVRNEHRFTVIETSLQFIKSHVYHEPVRADRDEP